MVWLLVRLITGKESRSDLAERRARAPGVDTAAPTIWLHGASLGELTAARPLISHMLAENQDLQIVVTANTTSGRNMAAGWGLARLHARLAPLDSQGVVARFLDGWQPRVAMSLENEIWPTRIMACASRNIPFLVIGARMSAASLAKWQRFPGLAKQVLASITGLAPQDAASSARFAQLGVPADKIGAPVNLKAAVHLPDADPALLARYREIFDRTHTVLAASTHAGEDEIILAGFGQAHQQNPQLRLILAPRHPDRADRIAGLIKQVGLGFSRRTSGDVIDIKNPVYLADTIGEMPLWYSLSAATLAGGSLVDRGGHTPIEPVQFGSAVIHGPFVANHAAAYAALASGNAAFPVKTAADINRAILKMTSGDTAATMATSARAALAAPSSDTPSPATLLARLNALSSGNLLPALLD